MRLNQRKDESKRTDDGESLTNHPILSMIDQITSKIPSEELSKLPPDLSKNLDHYLYGLPKID